MKKIDEVQVLTNVRLSNAQKFVLTKLSLPNITPLTGYESVSNGKNVVANRDVLVKLGMVTVGQNEAQITDQGKEALKNEALVDEMGTLTPQGEKFAYAENIEDLADVVSQGNVPEMPDTEAAPEQPKQNQQQMPMGLSGTSNGEGEGGNAFESWDMIANMQTSLSEEAFLNKQKK